MSEEGKRYSFEKINYILRPCKQIERKIIIETLQKLKPEINIEEYKYIGMGSIYYYDFVLFYKFLNMKKLLSIDDKETEKRFKFNKPYDFIEFQNKKSTDFLNDFTWDEKVLIWLDYDQKLNYDILNDIEIVIKNCTPKDILIFTVNAKCPSDWKKREAFQQNFKKYISLEFRSKRFVTPKNFATLLHNICVNYIREKEIYQKINFHQIFSFKYEDGAPMLTCGGIFDENDEIIKKIDHLDFICTDMNVIEIDAPVLTYCEKFHIDQNIERYENMIKDLEKKITSGNQEERKKNMNRIINEELPFELFSIDELKSYIKYCKYFPQYYEGII